MTSLPTVEVTFPTAVYQEVVGEGVTESVRMQGIYSGHLASDLDAIRSAVW